MYTYGVNYLIIWEYVYIRTSMPSNEITLLFRIEYLYILFKIEYLYILVGMEYLYILFRNRVFIHTFWNGVCIHMPRLR